MFKLFRPHFNTGTKYAKFKNKWSIHGMSQVKGWHKFTMVIAKMSVCFHTFICIWIWIKIYICVQRYMYTRLNIYVYSSAGGVQKRDPDKDTFLWIFQNVLEHHFERDLSETLSVYKYELNTKIYSARIGELTDQIRYGSCAYKNNHSQVFSDNNPYKNVVICAEQNVQRSLTKVSGLL